MKVKNISPRDQAVTLRKNGIRICNTVKPGEIVECSNIEGITLISKKPFIAADEESKRILEESMPRMETARSRRRMTNTESQAEADLQVEKKVISKTTKVEE